MKIIPYDHKNKLAHEVQTKNGKNIPKKAKIRWNSPQDDK